MEQRIQDELDLSDYVTVNYKKGNTFSIGACSAGSPPTGDQFIKGERIVGKQRYREQFGNPPKHGIETSQTAGGERFDPKAGPRYKSEISCALM